MILKNIHIVYFFCLQGIQAEVQMRKSPSRAAVYGRTHESGFSFSEADARSTQAIRSPYTARDANANWKMQTGERQPNANCKMQIQNCRPQNANWKMQTANCKLKNAKCKLKNECRSPTHCDFFHRIDIKFTISRDCQGLPVNVWQKSWHREKNINLGKPGEDRDHAAGIVFPVIVGGCRCRFAYDRRRLLFSFGPSAADTDFYFFPVSIFCRVSSHPLFILFRSPPTTPPRVGPGQRRECGRPLYIYRCREKFFRLFRKKYLKCCLTSVILYMMLNNIKRTLTT